MVWICPFGSFYIGIDVVAYLKWQFAMSEEIVALERTGTWDLVSLPPGIRPMICKWDLSEQFLMSDLGPLLLSWDQGLFYL